jgi:hypothetical protein
MRLSIEWHLLLNVKIPPSFPKQLCGDEYLSGIFSRVGETSLPDDESTFR